jgi:Glycosyl transferase 4-like domain
VAGHQGLERVRVLRIIARLNIGGPALHTTLLTERLDPRRYDARLIAGTEGPDEGNYLRLHGATPERVTILPALGRWVRGVADLLVLYQLLGVMRRLRPHVVHTHTAKGGTFGRLARQTGAGTGRRANLPRPRPPRLLSAGTHASVPGDGAGPGTMDRLPACRQ